MREPTGDAPPGLCTSALRSASSTPARTGLHRPLTLTRPGAPDETGLHLAIIANTAPWTFLGRLAVNPTPDASFDTGLDLLALRKLRTFSTLRHARQLLWPSSRSPRGRDLVALHDQAEFTLWANRPTAWQLDGDHLGKRMSVRFSAVPEALRVYI